MQNNQGAFCKCFGPATRKPVRSRAARPPAPLAPVRPEIFPRQRRRVGTRIAESGGGKGLGDARVCRRFEIGGVAVVGTNERTNCNRRPAASILAGVAQPSIPGQELVANPGPARIRAWRAEAAVEHGSKGTRTRKWRQKLCIPC